MKLTVFFKIIFCFIFLLFLGCKDIDSTFKEYVVPGGLSYPEKAKNPVVYSGNNRVKVVWQKGSDQRVTQGRIFWNNYLDSVEVITTDNSDLVNCLIENMQEGIYSFFIYTYDDSGNVSIPVETSGTVYGNNYIDDLQNRPISHIQIENSSDLWIYWGKFGFSDAIAMEVQFTDEDNANHSMLFDINQDVTLIENYGNKSSFQYRTLFLPDTLCIDTFYTNFSTYQLIRQ